MLSLQLFIEESIKWCLRKQCIYLRDLVYIELINEIFFIGFFQVKFLGIVGYFGVRDLLEFLLEQYMFFVVFFLFVYIDKYGFYCYLIGLLYRWIFFYMIVSGEEVF